MMYASLHGRLGKDAQAIETRTGKPMTAASLAVDVSPRDQEATLWVRVVAFGKLADLLAKHAKGDTLAASGRLEVHHWTADDGTERESWQLIADALHSAGTVRPGGKGGKRDTQLRGNGTAACAPFKDELPF